MTATVHEVEIWVLIDELGEYVVGRSPEELSDLYDDQVQGNVNESRRCVKVVLKVPVESYVTLTGEAPAEGTATLTIAE